MYVYGTYHVAVKSTTTSFSFEVSIRVPHSDIDLMLLTIVALLFFFKLFFVSSMNKYALVYDGDVLSQTSLCRMELFLLLVAIVRA